MKKISEENTYKRRPRTTNQEYRIDLEKYQIPAIKQHIGNLNNRVFLDIGAGTIIPGSHLNEIGKPNKYYAQDIHEAPLNEGIAYMNSKGIDTSIFEKLVSDDFNFSSIQNQKIDCAFSNSLFSHLSIGSICHCLKNLKPKMKNGASYFTSMIILPDDIERTSYSWHHIKKKYSNVTSHSNKDPFHYTQNFLRSYPFRKETGFYINNIHPYGHPIQELVEFVNT